MTEVGETVTVRGKECIVVAVEGRHIVVEPKVTNPAGPVSGYKPQTPEAVALVNRFKESEERILREIDALDQPLPALNVDRRWLAIARTDLQRGYMALNRAVFQPGRVKLPEDGE